VFCETLGAWLIPNDRLLHIADDRGGTQRWLTAEENERIAKEQAQAEWERERAARLDLERELALLKRMNGNS
jgi:hypothetical protein